MASSGQLINQSNIGNGVAYSASGDTSTSYWSYAFGNSIWWRAKTGTASNIYEKHPAITCEFWRFSISSQTWIMVHSVNIGKSSQTVYRVRNNQMPISGTVTAEYNGDDSYLFAFKAYTYEGERSQTEENIYVYNIGADTTYNTTVKGKLIYGRDQNYAFQFHKDSSGPSSFSRTQDYLTTDGMRGTLITPSLVNRMVSVRSAVSKT
ncbi:MAG: hypothetical protein ACOWWR_07785 [Eubacteriales bacterium]